MIIGGPPHIEDIEAAVDCILEALRILSPKEKAVEFILEDALTLLGYGDVI